MKHEFILGYDELNKHKFHLDTEFLLWGQDVFKLLNDDVCEIDSVECEFGVAVRIQKVLQKYKNVFREGCLPTDSLPAIEIETEPGKVVHRSPYRLPLAKREVVESEISKNA